MNQSSLKLNTKEKISALLSFFNGLINKGHERSVKAKKNILASFLIKGGSILTSFLLIPITIDYVNPTRYGIWITLSSIIGWFSFFDIGFGNGLRNRLAESIAKGDYEIAKIYVSTTYAILSIIVVIVLLLFFFLNPFLNWTKILNAPSNMSIELRLLALIVFIIFCLQFVLQLITTVMTANQESAKASLITFIGSGLSLIVIFILTKTTSGNLIYLAAILGSTPVLVLAASSIWFYKYEYKVYAPSIRCVRMNFARGLMELGIKFFIIQIGVVVLFQTDNIVVTQLFGPEEVTIFNVAFKLFSIVMVTFAIFVTPLWSAFTEAYTKADFEWIRAILLKIRKVRFFFVTFTVFLLFASPFIFKWWLGNNVKVPFLLSIALSTYVIAYTWQATKVFFLNGIGKIQLQVYLVIISSIINIPIAIVLGKKIGLAGITLSNALIFIITGVFFSIQTKKIINHKASGVWNK